MHYSAKRCLAIACRLSARLSVTLVDHEHIGRKSLKLISRTISPTHSPFVAQTTSTYSEDGVMLGRLEVGWEKMVFWSTKAAISTKRVKIEKKLLWEAYRNSPTLFRTVPSPTPYGLLFPKTGGSQPNPKRQSLLSQERVELPISNLAGTFIGSIRTKAN